MNPILVYLLLLLGGTAIWCGAAHAWIAAGMLWVAACWLLGQWASVKAARAIRRIQLHAEVRRILNERQTR